MADPHRTTYHFQPAANWMNDPNGLIQWKGQYHLFYQYNPLGAFHHKIHCGHAVSTDLVHWTELPVALEPTPGGPDEDGCWSGCAVNDAGVPTLIYTGTQASWQHACIATSVDDLLTWQKYPGNPVIAAPPAGLDLEGFRDHSAWKEGDTWYQVIGAGIKGVGGTALLYRSPDLRTWEYLHPLCTGDKRRTEPIWTGSMWECPDFFRLGDRQVLIVSVWDQEELYYPAYATGRYAGHRFMPEQEGMVDLGRSFYAPQSFADDRGRRIMFGWLREGRGGEAQRAAGWSGVMSLPRVLSLRPDGTLGMEPAPELRVLRGKHHHWSAIDVTPDSSPPLEEVHGAHREFVAELDVCVASVFGLRVRCAPDGAEETLIVFSPAERQLRIDRTHSSLSPDADDAPRGGMVDLGESERLKLNVFLDGSVVEVFANGRSCLTERIYPTRSDSLGLGLLARGGRARLSALDIWEMGEARSCYK